jgi:hypothetical protein
MKLVRDYIHPAGSYLLGQDRRGVCHGIFCWSAEQITAISRDWRLTPKEENRLVKTFMQQEIELRSKQEPRMIHGVGAALVDHQFQTLRHVREITDPRRTKPLTQGHIYFRTQAKAHQEHEAALLFYVTPEGKATLAHIRTQDQAAELLKWEDWMVDDTNHGIVEMAIDTLPEFDRFNQQSTIIHGDLIQQLIAAQVIYLSFFPNDPTVRN